MFEFDRQNGTLSNLRQIPFSLGEELKFATHEWSSNSRYLYIATQDSLWQVDTYEDNLEDGRIFIDAYDGVGDPHFNGFFDSALGPDCRVYLRTGNSTNSFHVIHKPDERGLDCDFQQRGVRLPKITGAGSFPNFPRFRVDEEDKCDPSIVSIVGETVWWRRDLKAYPSPALSLIHISEPTRPY